MCGNGLPVDAAASRPTLTIVLTILVVGGLFACAFLYGKWRADVTPMSASVPAFAPSSRPRPSASTTAAPVTADSANTDGRPRP